VGLDTSRKWNGEGKRKESIEDFNVACMAWKNTVNVGKHRDFMKQPDRQEEGTVRSAEWRLQPKSIPRGSYILTIGVLPEHPRKGIPEPYMARQADNLYSLYPPSVNTSSSRTIPIGGFVALGPSVRTHVTPTGTS